MWKEETEQDYLALKEFWNTVFQNREEKEITMEDLRSHVPSEKLIHAAESLGDHKKILDYGCGTGWGGILAASAGCMDVTSVDVQQGSVNTARKNVSALHLEDQIHVQCVSADWLSKQPAGIYDGFFCSNVADVVPSEIAEEIIRESARVTTDEADVIFSMNYCMTKEKAMERGYLIKEGNSVYIDGILRLVSRTDKEWIQIFEQYYTAVKLEYFKWPSEEKETRRLFYLKKKTMQNM